MDTKQRAPRNRTITLSESERQSHEPDLLSLSGKVSVAELTDRIIRQDVFAALDCLPTSFVDLLFIDPPYNLSKTFNSNVFREMNTIEYTHWVDSWLGKLVPALKRTASVYICGDWRSSGAIQQVAEKYFKVRNRITWEREKGRGAKSNWKNNSEDIWFCTVSDEYYFDVEAVKLKRKVIAPYTHENGEPKDWERTDNGGYRLTHPSNIWSDLTVPFWSMAENTDHPTQKPEKLLAKVILASSRPGDFVFDPFLGSGTSSVVAKKLGRHFLGIELDETYACLALKRLRMADTDNSIQGYSDGVFWERNSFQEQSDSKRSKAQLPDDTISLFHENEQLE
jgi:site-specific DNA-methyltransferase (adenine-specific)